MEELSYSEVNSSSLEPRPIAIRAFAWPPKKKFRKPEKRWNPLPPSNWYLVFDSETFTDAAQQLRVGTYQLLEGNMVHEEGFFYDPQSLTAEELSLLESYAESHDKTIRTLEEFIREIFFGVFEVGGTFLGFNMGFDFSRLAASHTLARGNMQGGFSFIFSLGEDSRQPAIRVKHLNAKASMFRLTVRPGRSPEKRNQEKGVEIPHYRGYFVDLKSLAAALLGRTDSLASLTDFLDTKHKKVETDEHGRTLTRQYLKYALNDVQATWECFEILRSKYDNLNLSQTLISQISSEAGLGKANLKEMGVKPWRSLPQAFSLERIGIILGTYGGGRSEVNLRRTIAQTLYCDFLSTYPSTCVLMGIWQFVIAQMIECRDDDAATEEVRHFLDKVSLEDFQKPETWQKLHAIVLVQAEGDLLPVRAPYGGERTLTLGLNYLTSHQPLWITLADCCEAKILTGKTPKVLKAIMFRPNGRQRGLKSILLAGNPAYPIDPKKDDFYKRLIDLRNEIKKSKDKAEKDGNQELAFKLDAEQKNLKIVANSAAYGIFLELNVTRYEKKRKVICYGSEGEGFPTWVHNIEEPGRYFHPLLGTWITAGARLLLALAQRLCEESDLTWIFADTDSLAITPKQEMTFEAFIQKVEKVREWFAPLNPYSKKESLLKLEDVNFKLENGKITSDLEPLFAFAVSAKRTALFNIDGQGCPIIRKASAHALGHLLRPYKEKEAPKTILPPAVKVKDKIGVERWQYDLWYRILEAALEGHSHQVKLDDLPGFKKFAVSQYAATTPKLLSWFDKYNEGKPHREQVRPFGFLLSFFADKKKISTEEEPSENTEGKSESFDDFPRPVAPFNKDTQAAAEKCFDRETGKAIPNAVLKTYREVLSQYHLHPEKKFLNGNFLDSGFTQHRHILETGREYIGKEANRWEERLYTGEDPEEQIHYGTSPFSQETAGKEILEGSSTSHRALARESQTSRNEFSRLRRGQKVKAGTVARIRQAQSRIAAEQRQDIEYLQQLLEKVQARCKETGLRQFSKEAGIDPGNLSKILHGMRKPSFADVAKLEKPL